ncbi:MAG: DNA-directed RNA polymerase subunit D [Candidatus Thermoplasmatota archaeon]|nr:DNA-directed RNA polymerase subunit D [Candidatus Thermoplasmatota archaeon]
MKLKFMEDGDDCIKVLIEGTTPDFVNAIRRTLLADVPKLAIENVTIYDNASALFDEIVAHRISLIPLPTDPDILVPREECICGGEGCPNCIVHYTLSKEGECTVYSGDLKAEDPVWAVKDDKIPILRLLKDQRIILEAEAELGTGKKHAKWQTVSGAGYTYYPKIVITNECNGCMECIKMCPRGVLGVKKGKVAVKNLEECSLCKSCAEACANNAIKVEGNPNKIIFHFETDGSLTARRAFIEGLKILYKKYDELEKAI